MTISLNETVAEVRRNFRDVKWSNETLKAWVKDGVRDYAKYFPQVAEFAGDATTGTYQYDFDATVMDIIEVEYPTGDDPPTYPLTMNHLAPGFFDGGESVVDVVVYPGEDQAELWLSDPVTGSSFNVKYHTAHAWTADGTDFTTEIPDFHRPIIVQYVTWQCWREMATIQKEKGQEKEYSFLYQRMVKEQDHYWSLLQMAMNSRPSESRVVKWTMDKYDSIY